MWSRARGVVKRAFALHCKNGGENIYIFVILNIFEMSAPRLGCKRKLQFKPILPNVTPIQSQRFCGFGNNIAFTQRKDSNENLQPQFNHVQVQNVSDQVGLSNSVAVTLPLAQNRIEAVQVYVKENYPQLQCQVWHEEDEQHCIVTRKTLSGAQQIIAGTGTAAISLDITSKGQYQLNVLLQPVKRGVLKETVFSQLLKDVSGETDKVICPDLTKSYELLTQMITALFAVLSNSIMQKGVCMFNYE